MTVMADELNKNGNQEIEKETNTNPDTTSQNNEETNEPSIEDLSTQLAQERAEKLKLKNSFDKAASETAELRKKLKAKMTAEEEEAEEKKIAEENHKAYVKSLEDKIALSTKTKNYMRLGMTEELAAATAKADLEGDEETVNSNIQRNQELKIKEAEQEWLRNRPEPQGGNEDDDNEKDPFVSGFEKGLKGY